MPDPLFEVWASTPCRAATRCWSGDNPHGSELDGLRRQRHSRIGPETGHAARSNSPPKCAPWQTQNKAGRAAPVGALCAHRTERPGVGVAAQTGCCTATSASGKASQRPVFRSEILASAFDGASPATTKRCWAGKHCSPSAVFGPSSHRRKPKTATSPESSVEPGRVIATARFRASRECPKCRPQQTAAAAAAAVQ